MIYASVFAIAAISPTQYHFARMKDRENYDGTAVALDGGVVQEQRL